MLNVIVGMFCTMVLVMGYGAGLIGYAYRGYFQAKHEGKPPMLDAFVHSILGFFISSGIIFVILGSVEVIGFPVKKYVAAFSGGGMSAITATFGLSPADVAATAVAHMSCIFAFTMNVIVSVVPVLLIVGAYVGFFVHREQKQRANVYDDIIDSAFGSVIMAFLVAFVSRITYEAMDYWGVPTIKFIHAIYDDTSFPIHVPPLNMCPTNLQNTLSAVLYGVIFFSKFAIAFSVFMVMLVSIIKKWLDIRDEHKQRPISPEHQFIRMALHIMLLAMIVPTFTWAILRVIFIHWSSIATWYSNFIFSVI